MLPAPNPFNPDPESTPAFRLYGILNYGWLGMRNRLTRWKRRQTWLASILSLDSLVGVGWLGALIAVIHIVALSLPNPALVSQRSDLVGFASTLWQVHAAVLAFTAIVITVIVTIVANQMYGRETWQLYRRTSWFFPIVSWNLLALISEGVTSFLLRSTSIGSILYGKTSNLVLAGGFIFLISIGLAIFLYWRTLRFLDSDYVEDLSEREIERSIHDETEREFQQLQQLVRDLNAGQQ